MSNPTTPRYLNRLSDVHCLRVKGLSMHIITIIADCMNNPIYVDFLKNGYGGKVYFRGRPVCYISSNGSIRLCNFGKKLNKNTWIVKTIIKQRIQKVVNSVGFSRSRKAKKLRRRARRTGHSNWREQYISSQVNKAKKVNKKDNKNFLKLTNLLEDWELRDGSWVVYGNNNNHLKSYFSQSGRYYRIRPKELDLLMPFKGKKKVFNENKKPMICLDPNNYPSGIVPGISAFARDYMKKNNLKYCIFIFWGLTPSIGYDSDICDWANMDDLSWFIGYAGKYFSKFVNFDKDIHKGASSEILKIVERKMFGRPSNGKYLDHYYIYGKTIDGLIKNLGNELERYRQILSNTICAHVGFSPYFIPRDGTWEDKLIRISKIKPQA